MPQRSAEVQVLLDLIYPTVLELANLWGVASERDRWDTDMITLRWKRHEIERAIEISLDNFPTTRLIQFAIGAWKDDQVTLTRKWNVVVVKLVNIPLWEEPDTHTFFPLLTALRDLINLWEDTDLTHTDPIKKLPLNP